MRQLAVDWEIRGGQPYSWLLRSNVSLNVELSPRRAHFSGFTKKRNSFCFSNAGGFVALLKGVKTNQVSSVKPKSVTSVMTLDHLEWTVCQHQCVAWRVLGY